LAATVSKDLLAVADTLGVRLHVLHASTEADFETAFATAAQLRVAALVISGADPVFGNRSPLRRQSADIRLQCPTAILTPRMLCASSRYSVGGRPSPVRSRTGWPEAATPADRRARAGQCHWQPEASRLL